MVSKGRVNDRTYRGASVIELIHTASLIHDDVVDDSHMRRGVLSVNAMWKNKIAVLVGDFLLSKGMLLSIDYDDFDLLKVISKAVREMSEGELLQIEKAQKLDIDEETYFEIIKKKTATLISACCTIGSLSVSLDKNIMQQMESFGYLIGIAFQIKDDLFDYSGKRLGKPTGIDIKEKKMTLPLIYTINNCKKSEKKWLITSIKKYNKDKKRVKEVIQFVIERGGLSHAEKKMYEYKNKALKQLEYFPNSPYKSSLEMMINYVVEREK
ncbi:polyprenyl synthetase [Elysia marginata]|uniref:Polyprenyl synthetase n=1 Tax=Elysia marginata TaxID=1093978 RepID=A0AAV4FMQ0_9GAST|nr:polyprenyl synthetase [Elysia marginata]